ncbi:MAG: hypothetical protein LBR22_09270 [Desulfovibrio sp.]|nr:hypothetical protein [Desulfovibrio sp.]
MQNENDLAKIRNGIEAPNFLERHLDRLICIDEIQLRPDIFRVLRSLCDIIAHSLGKDYQISHPARFLVLGSASPILLAAAFRVLGGENFIQAFDHVFDGRDSRP